MPRRWGNAAAELLAATAALALAHSTSPSPSSASPGVPRHPKVSWRTVPVFAETSNVTGVFDEAALGSLARFPLFVGEKAYAYPLPGFAEDKLTGLAQELRRRAPNITLVFYYNANLDLTDYRLYNLTAQHAPDWWVRNSSGDPLIAPIDGGTGATPPFPYDANGGGVPCYDFTVPEVRRAWVEECFAMTSEAGGFDGCMVDRWTRTPFKGQPGFTPEYIATWVEAQGNATSELAARASAAGTYLVGEGTAVAAQSDPGYGFRMKGGVSLKQQLLLAEQGVGLLASYVPGTTGASWVSQLASFLVGAGPGHFFGAGSWTVNATRREGVDWHPEYDLPLGAPLENATVDASGDVYSRRFALGTNVSFDTRLGTGTIAWGKFPPGQNRIPTKTVASTPATATTTTPKATTPKATTPKATTAAATAMPNISVHG